MYPAGKSCPKISVVVITHNEGLNLRRTVENLQDTLPPNGEIVVVDDRSSDGSTDFLAQAQSRVSVVRPGRRLGISQARNYGANRTSGRIIVFCDAHLSFPRHWHQLMMELLEDPRIGGVAP